MTTFETISHRILANFAAGILIVWRIAIFIFALLRYQRSVKRLKKATGYVAPIEGTIIIVAGLVFISLIILYHVI